MSDLDIITFGCRLNSYESEVMREHANAAGLADAVIVNTCAVTGEAVRQARQAIRKARRERPNAKIVVTGCAAQIDPDQFARMDEVDRVVGNQEKLEARTFQSLGLLGHGPMCRSRTAAIIAVRSALSRTDAVRRGRCPQAKWWRRSAASSRTAIGRLC
jgi:hypothetical protein